MSGLSDFVHTHAYLVSKPCSCIRCRLTSRPAYKRANGQKHRPALSVDAQGRSNSEMMMRELSNVDCLDQITPATYPTTTNLPQDAHRYLSISLPRYPITLDVCTYTD